jgi:hypothetical protein
MLAGDGFENWELTAPSAVAFLRAGHLPLPSTDA